MIKLTKYGIREWLGSGIIACLSASGAVYLSKIYGMDTIGWAVAAFAGLAWFCIAAFFRDPRRKIPEAPDVMVAPADGVIRDIELVKNHGIEPFEGKDALRIGIFLSVLDVHLNRAPCNFSIEYELYTKGKFHDARDKRASKENESMIIAGNAEVNGLNFPVAVKQISGAIARRIVCSVKTGQSLLKGRVYGMIKLGSRTDLYIPAENDMQVLVKVGDRVYAGETLLVKVLKPQNKPKVEQA
jgi:phosphatidylserine decarboxylase